MKTYPLINLVILGIVSCTHATSDGHARTPWSRAGAEHHRNDDVPDTNEDDQAENYLANEVIHRAEQRALLSQRRRLLRNQRGPDRRLGHEHNTGVGCNPKSVAAGSYCADYAEDGGTCGSYKGCHCCLGCWASGSWTHNYSCYRKTLKCQGCSAGSYRASCGAATS